MLMTDDLNAFFLHGYTSVLYREVLVTRVECTLFFVQNGLYLYLHVFQTISCYIFIIINY